MHAFSLDLPTKLLCCTPMQAAVAVGDSYGCVGVCMLCGCGMGGQGRETRVVGRVG